MMKIVSNLLACMFLFAVQATAQDNALNFDGTNDYAIAPASTNIDITNGTVECWVNPHSFSSTSASCILGNRGSGGTKYSFHMTATSFGLWNGSAYFAISYNFITDVWYHLAFVSNYGNTKYYVNGDSVGTSNYGFSITTNGQPLVIGAVKEGGTSTENFSGSIDEVRIWNTVRTQSQIQTNKNIALNGTESGLVALYNFNQGTASGSNTGIVSVTDVKSGNNAVLNNFALTGNNSNFISSILGGTPTVSITSPATNSGFVAGTNVTLVASASDLAGIDSVQFLANDVRLGISTGSLTYSYLWNSVSAGNYVVKAKAFKSGNAGVSTLSSPITVFMNNAQSGGTAWGLTGNAGTVATNNFLGTTDNQAINFKTNNIERLTMHPDGNISIGTTTPSSDMVTIKQQANGYGLRLQGPGGTSNFLQLGINGRSTSEMRSNSRLDITAGLDAKDQLYVTAGTIFLQGNTVIGRLGDPDKDSPNPTATQQGSRAMPFESHLWDGTTDAYRYAGLINIASTTQNLKHRLAFKVLSPTSDLSGGIEALSILSNGSIGIGIITPDTTMKLSVNGNIKAQKLIVSQTGWADYVFHNTYKLPSLEVVEAYIKSNKHLPEVPSVSEVDKNGINVGDNQVVLLKKIEELTLYLIDQDKRIKAQDRMIKKQYIEMNLLKKQMNK